jgi:hypothetical protein|tara:strand:+ start:405 stop:635 length:231 start_codon:yes stop_codon:yes gene_type:complete
MIDVLCMYKLTKTRGKNTMSTFFAMITILSAVMAVGSIEDCGGHCLGQENWKMFFICLTTMIISGIITLLTQKEGQ